MTAETITPELRKAIEKTTYEEDGQTMISISNSRLDFSKKYKVLGFTSKVIKLAWKNGTQWIPCQGRIKKSYDYYVLYTEGWSFINHIKLGEQK